jgi:hypothetical protein
MFKTQNLYQNDEKWKSVRLGNSSETIGGWGCLLTSVTMMLNGIGYNETPDTVNEKMKKSGGFQGAFFIPSVLPYIWPNCAYRDMQPCENSSAPIAQIDAALEAGKPVILQVDWNKQAGIQTHFVLVKEKKGNDYSIYDPYKYGGDSPEKDVLLTSRYKYNGATIEKEISAVLWFDSVGSAPVEPPKQKVALPADRFLLYATEDDLALRAEPSVDGYLWKRLVLGTELISLETKARTQAKLGAVDQWIHVQDPAGDQGHVAAWYVSAARDAASGTASPGSSPSSSNLPPGALLFVPLEELSLRSEPVIDPKTLIRRIPVTEELVSIEPASQAIPKVGIVGKWLKVRDATNREGYIAAWYIKYASGTQPGQTPAATGPVNGGPVKVRATAEAIALRKKPLVSEATLIKRLPLGTEFVVTEPNAENKIGKNDQWLKVRDATGSEGYIAAWFVARC